MLVCFVQNGNGRFLAGAKINLLTRHLKGVIEKDSLMAFGLVALRS